MTRIDKLLARIYARNTARIHLDPICLAAARARRRDDLPEMERLAACDYARDDQPPPTRKDPPMEDYECSSCGIGVRLDDDDPRLDLMRGIGGLTALDIAALATAEAWLCPECEAAYQDSRDAAAEAAARGQAEDEASPTTTTKEKTR